MDKYEEALERARQGMPIDKIFPELYESEDERIICNIKKAAELYWSDEPLNEILSWLEKQKEPRDYRKLYEEVVKSDWFKENYVGKSLGEGHQPAEWSEEDGLMLIDAVAACRVAYGDTSATVKWLRTLCPNHWKPSKEQLRDLKFYAERPDTSRELMRLYNDLKKL